MILKYFSAPECRRLFSFSVGDIKYINTEFDFTLKRKPYDALFCRKIAQKKSRLAKEK